MNKILIHLLIFITVVYSDGHLSDCKEYDKIDNDNPFGNKFCLDNKLIGHWISEDDNGKDTTNNYGIIFTKTDYMNHTTYRYGKMWIIDFIGKGQWTIYKNRLLINCSLIKTVYEYDSTKLFGKTVSVDTFPNELFHMKYHLENDSTLCFYWKTYKKDIYSQFPHLFEESLNLDVFQPDNELICKKECYKRINNSIHK